MKKYVLFPVLVMVLVLTLFFSAPVFGGNAQIGDFVWLDTNMNGIQDVGEPGLPNVTVNLYISDGQFVATTITNADGKYGFSMNLAGTGPYYYYLEFVKPAGYTFSPKEQGSNDIDSDADISTGKTDLIPVSYGTNDPTWDAGMYRLGPPGIGLTKSTDDASVAPGVSVTYSYTVKNTGGVTLTDVTVKDDNGTPGYPADDFVVGIVPSLAPGEEWTFQVTKIPPVCLCVSVDGTSMENLLIIEIIPDQNSPLDGIEDIRVTYRQSRDLVDNVYGTPANDPASGWYPKHHNFSDFTGSDKAQFRFTDSLGNVVLDFKADYISASSKYPSGYGTLGVTGGDGGMIVGSATNVLDVNTTITANLNQSPSFYGYTVNSPPEPFPGWDYVDGYTVVVSGALFEDNGFGNATVYSVHNSPPKIGTNEALPKPCDWDATNTAYVTAKAGDTTLTATASTTVKVTGGSIAPPGPFTTYKQDQWGGDPKKAPGAKLLNQNFSTVYPTGVSVGGTYKLSFTSAAAVLAFLPQGGGPSVLKMSANNPTKSDAGELAGQVLALQLNVDFSNAGVTHSGLATLQLASGKMKGKTVAEVLSLSNQILGKSVALPAGISMKDLNGIVKKINENYENGTHDRGYLQ